MDGVENLVSQDESVSLCYDVDSKVITTILSVMMDGDGDGGEGPFETWLPLPSNLDPNSKRFVDER